MGEQRTTLGSCGAQFSETRGKVFSEEFLCCSSSVKALSHRPGLVAAVALSLAVDSGIGRKLDTHRISSKGSNRELMAVPRGIAMQNCIPAVALPHAVALPRGFDISVGS